MKNTAIYTRVSTSSQADIEYNSCEAQRDKILSYVRSQEDLKFHKEYVDAGFSAASLDRPALKQLLNDIAAGNVQVVLTYKIDRLSRSSKDFYTLIDYFEKYGVAYVSVTEHFDTSSPSGRLLRNIMLTFAQFEREMTSERTKDKLLQRAKKGLWSAPRTPLGYKKADKKLIVDKKTAPIVRGIFETYVATGSLTKALQFARSHDAMGQVTKRPLDQSTLWNILRNPTYIGKMRWSGRIFSGIHEPLISNNLFEEAQGLMTKKIKLKRLYKEYLLSGLVKCATCGSSMTNCFTNKKKRRYYYYKCTKVVHEGKHACPIKEVNAEKLESFLIENLSRIALDSQYIESLVFKMLHTEGAHKGFELLQESSKTGAHRVQQVLINFKNQIQNGSQIERSLVFRRVIQKVKFSKSVMEIIINIEDVNDLGEPAQNAGLRGGVAGQTSAGASDLRAPACSSEFDSLNWGG